MTHWVIGGGVTAVCGGESLLEAASEQAVVAAKWPEHSHRRVRKDEPRPDLSSVYLVREVRWDYQREEVMPVNMIAHHCVPQGTRSTD
jgi:hypothetical protein